MFRKPRLPLHGVLFLAVVLPSLGRADLVEVPLVVDARFVASRVAQALELDETGRGQIRSDPCNRVELSDLVLATPEGELLASLAVRAITGVQAMGRCRGPSPWHGRMIVALEPAVEDGGRGVAFTPTRAELVRPDGAPGLLSRPTRTLAESLVLPRVGRARLDLTESLATIDGLLASSFSPGAQVFTEGTRIHTLAVVDTGLSLSLRFHVEMAPDTAIAPAEPPLHAAELAQWQRLEDELDGFLTTVISALAAPPASTDLRLELLAVLLDARHGIAEAFSAVESDEGLTESGSSEADPVRRIFLESWDRLRPWLAEVDGSNVTGLESDLRLAAFMAGGDALRALDALGPAFRLEISSDGLRRLARLLLAEDAPEQFTPLPLGVDPAFRSLFNLDAPADPGPQGLLWNVLDVLIPVAAAREISPAEALRGVVPRLATLDDYLRLVARLLQQQTGAHLSAGSRFPARLEPRVSPLVWATAWKESCWRQFVGSSENPRVLTSPVGALGMMQINGRVWRGTYDLKRLAQEIDYNVAAGTKILEHYLVDYAIRRGEHNLPGGDDNLIRATYAAYNGGPSHLGRYRRDDTPGRLRAIDNEFWRHYQVMKAEQWPDVASCFAVGG
jgi:hypothetical protein